ncbi:MAG: N-acetylmuramoyl-L-alanine amidase [Clostridia bacterium]|nr:N-acetylmuramoyl-L-alanine amidase [Clostridia bacterium]
MSKCKYIIITLFILLFSFIGAHAAQEMTLYLDGKLVKTDVAPIAIDGYTMVPVRSIFEKMGAEVTWIGSRQQVIIRSVKARIVLNLDSTTAYVNNKSVELEKAPMAMDGRTLIPVRFVSEKLGYNVKWEPSDNSVHITTSKQEEPKIQNAVKKITVSKKTTSTVITVKLSKMQRPDISYASDPMRFIADFPDTTLSVSGSKQTVDSFNVSEVRYAIHPDYTRVVIESPSEEVSYKVSYTADSVVITVSGGSKTQDNKEDTKEETKDDKESFVKEEIGEVSDNRALVVIDAGHGGYDSGAIGYDEDGEPVVYESKANLEIALAVQKYLEDANVSVIMTRTKDVAMGSTEMEDLLARSEIANNSGATFFVSIHNNSFTDDTASGTEILYTDNETKIYDGVTSKELAQNILTPLVKATGLQNRGVKDSPKIVVLRTTTMPSVLIETAFVSNAEDRLVLTDSKTIDNIGYAIAQGIVESLGELD